MIKKLSIMISAIVLTASFGMFGAQQVINQLNPAAQQFGTNSLNRRLSINEQNASLNTWNTAFNNAKTFVINNSKNLVGVRDTDIINALNALDKANNDINNVIKITRGLSSTVDLRNQQTQLKTIQGRLVQATNALNRVNMTLSNKKEAKSVIMSIGRFLEQVIQNLSNIIQQIITAATPALPPRGTPSAPSRPTPARPEAPKPMIGECVICLEEKEVVKIPCKNNHPNDFICKEDLEAIRRTTNKCPICREPLLPR